jgi:hypothetical protein
MAESCPQHPKNPLVKLVAEPTFHYVLTCGFLFYVFMCSTLLESLVGYNVRRFISNHEWPKHAIALMLLLFTIGVLNDMPNLLVSLVATVLVYLWFILMSKLPGAWSMAIIGLLGVAFVVNELVNHYYTPEWVYDVPPHASAWSATVWWHRESRQSDTVRRAARQRVRKQLISTSWGFGLTALTLTLLLTAWFYSPWRTRGLAQRPDASGALWHFAYQPDAFQPQPWALTSQVITLEEKYELDAIVTAVLKKLRSDKLVARAD